MGPSSPRVRRYCKAALLDVESVPPAVNSATVLRTCNCSSCNAVPLRVARRRASGQEPD